MNIIAPWRFRRIGCLPNGISGSNCAVTIIKRAQAGSQIRREAI